MTSNQIAKQTYQKLLDEISGIYDSAMRDIHAAVDEIFKKAYWQIGRGLAHVRSHGSGDVELENVGLMRMESGTQRRTR